MTDGTGTEIGFAGAGALAGLLSVSGIAMLAGYSLSWTLREGNLSRNVHYVLVVCALGAALVIAWRQYARITAVGGTLVLFGRLATSAPDTFPPTLTVLTIELTVLAVLFIHAAGIEYGLRNPATIRSVFTRRAVKVGAGVGVCHTLVVLALHVWFGFSTAFFRTIGNVALSFWALSGTFLVGAGVGVALTRYRLVTPALVVAGLLSWVTLASLPHRGAFGFTVIALYEFGWYVVLLVAFVAGFLEHVFRPWILRHVVAPSRLSK
jgi:hypothetical protein